MNVPVINSFDRKLATIVGFEPYYTTYKLTIKHEDITEPYTHIIYGESYDLCLQTPKNLRKLNKLKELDIRIGELRDKQYRIIKEMEGIINTEAFIEMLKYPPSLIPSSD